MFHSGDQRKIMAQDVARLTGGTAITGGLEVPLTKVCISDFDRAKVNITTDKNRTLAEDSGLGHNQAGFEPSY